MRIVAIKKFVAEEDRATWLVDGLLPDTNWGIIYGESGLGKTTLMVQLCNALETGKPFLGKVCQRTRTIYFQADSPAIEWREILNRISPVSPGYTVVDIPDGGLGNPEIVQRMRNYVEQFSPGFLVFDSFFILTNVDLNTKQALQPIQTMKQLAQDPQKPGTMLPWFLIHHPPHDAHRPAGSMAISATCGTVWGLLPSQLKIDKGRLMAKTHIPLERDREGLWHRKSEVRKTERTYDPRLDRY